MFLSSFSIRQPLVIIVIVIMLVCFGLLALSSLRVNQLPDVDQPLILININYPGASPETVEREVIDRVEKALQSIPQVSQIRSTANEGEATILITFNYEKNMVEASDEVRNAIATVRHKLPTEMHEPILLRSDPFAQPAMLLALSSSTLSHSEISRLAEDTLADKFRGIDGVSLVNVSGALRRELSVLLHSEKLREYGISPSEVVAALRDQNTTAPVGRVIGSLEEQSIRLVGRIESPSEFERIVVKRRGDEIVRLGQVATIEDGFGEVSSLSFRNGKPNVGISIIRARNASTVAVADKVRKMVADINTQLPVGTKLEIAQDGGKSARNSLENVIEALAFGALLTVTVVYIFLNSWRSTLITALSLPTSVTAAFIAIWAFGFSLNFMTLLGLSLAIGVLIDDAIVVRENIVRHMELGLDRRAAARIGTQEIGVAVAATTFSIVAVFIPVAFMHGGAGAYFRPFALTVTSSVLVSLFISFTLDPMLSAYWGDPEDYRQRRKRGVGLWLANFNSRFDRLADRYSGVIAWALRRRRYMAAIACISFLAALVMQGLFGGSSFQPATDFGQIAIEVRTPASSSLEYNKFKVEEAAELARTLPETVATNSTVSVNGGRIYVDIGKVTERKRSADKIALELRRLVSRRVGAEYTVLEDLNIGVEKPVHIQFSGPDARRLMSIASDFMEKFAKVPGAVDVGLSELEPKDELVIKLDRGLASSLGVSVNDVAQALRVAFGGVEVGDWVDPSGETRDVAVRLHPEDRVDATNIEHLPILVGGSDMMVPLNQIASIAMGKGPAQIQHSDGKRMIAVSANAQGRSPGEVTAEALKIAEQISFPPGYGIELGGASRDQQKVFGEMFTALIMGVALMYLILVIQFGSFTAPLAVMLSLPLSLVGVVAGLLLTHCTLNLMSLIGIIMLMGLVAKNAILLLDSARKEETQGINREQALLLAGRARLRPILMTTFALIAGMLPVAIGLGVGGSFYRPMAVAIIGGTVTSTLLTLLVVPTFYDSIEIARERAIAKFRRRELHWNILLAFMVTLLEAILTLLFVRIIYRQLRKCYVWLATRFIQLSAAEER